jgi:hypothetical protein
MNWPHFILWVAGLYLVYYFALIVFDLSRSRNPQDQLHELTFTEDVAPKTIEHLPDKSRENPKTNSPIIASGGVSLKNLFNLCREEAVVYTRPVSF